MSVTGLPKKHHNISSFFYSFRVTLIIRQQLASPEETDFIKALLDNNRPAHAVIDVVERVSDMFRGKLTTRYVKVKCILTDFR